MNRLHYILGCLLLLFASVFTSCEKDPTIREVHEDLIIEDNLIPPYNGVSTIEIQNYVNKLYIELYGREPLAQEMSNGVAILVSGNLDSTVRASFVDQLMTSQEYYDRLDDILRNNFLEGFDSLSVVYQINLFRTIAQQDSINGGVQYIFLNVEIDRMVALQNAKNDYRLGNISLNEFYARYVYNFFYDEVNMGSENFVIACFENLLKRLPTDIELENGVKMVDGESIEIFLTAGDSKLDFVEIVTHVNEFYQGVITDFYATTLVREPTSHEVTTQSIELKSTGDMQAFQRSILISEEYAGF